MRAQGDDDKTRASLELRVHGFQKGMFVFERQVSVSRDGEFVRVALDRPRCCCCAEAEPRENITVITLGGRVRAVTLGEVDNFAQRSLREIFVDVAFLGSNGVSLEHGITTPDAAEADIKRLILKAAKKRVLLADHSKVGVTSVW
jgi:hypothetical protein